MTLEFSNLSSMALKNYLNMELGRKTTVVYRRWEDENSKYKQVYMHLGYQVKACTSLKFIG